MHDIICPHCGKAFKIDEAGYANILKQVRDGDFEKQLHDRLELAERDKRTAIELAEDEDAKAMLRLYGIKFTAAYPIVLPPDVPAEQVAILRNAFVAVTKDPEYRAQMDALRITGGMVTPAAVERLVKEANGAPPDLIERLRQALEIK